MMRGQRSWSSNMAKGGLWHQRCKASDSSPVRLFFAKNSCPTVSNRVFLAIEWIFILFSGARLWAQPVPETVVDCYVEQTVTPPCIYLWSRTDQSATLWHFALSTRSKAFWWRVGLSFSQLATVVSQPVCQPISHHSQLVSQSVS
jgi:hypothetical protein